MLPHTFSYRYLLLWLLRIVNYIFHKHLAFINIIIHSQFSTTSKRVAYCVLSVTQVYKICTQLNKYIILWFCLHKTRTDKYMQHMRSFIIICNKKPIPTNLLLKIFSDLREVRKLLISFFVTLPFCPISKQLI